MDRLTARLDALPLCVVRRLAKHAPYDRHKDALIEDIVLEHSKNELDHTLARFPARAQPYVLELPELLGEVLRHVRASREVKVAAKVSRAWNGEMARVVKARKMRVRTHATVDSVYPNLEGGFAFAAATHGVFVTRGVLAIGCVMSGEVLILDEEFKRIACVTVANATGVVQWGASLVVAAFAHDGEGVGIRYLMAFPGWSVLYKEATPGTFESLCVHDDNLYVLARNDAADDGVDYSSKVYLFDRTTDVPTIFRPDHFRTLPALCMTIVDDLLCFSIPGASAIVVYALNAIHEPPVRHINVNVFNIVTMCGVAGRLFAVDMTNDHNLRAGRRIVSIDPHYLRKDGVGGRIVDEVRFDPLEAFPKRHEADVVVCASEGKVYAFDKFGGAGFENAVTVFDGFA